MRFNFTDPGEARVIELHGRRLWRFEDGTIVPYIAGAFEGDGGAGGGGTGSGEGGTGSGGTGSGGSGGSGSGEGGSGGDGDSSSGGSGEGDHGFPAGTPVAEMTEKQQAAYWKFQSRKHEARAEARKDYDDVKAKAAQYDALAAASKTEQERAVEAAKDEASQTARAEERAKAAVRLVDAEMRATAAVKGVDGEKLKVVLEPLDRTKFLDSEGEVDTDKVVAFIAGIAPSDTGKNGRFPDLGQGRREGDGGKPSLEAGRDRWRSRHPAKQS
jgi:hypothetical protein